MDASDRPLLPDACGGILCLSLNERGWDGQASSAAPCLCFSRTLTRRNRPKSAKTQAKWSPSTTRHGTATSVAQIRTASMAASASLCTSTSPRTRRFYRVAPFREAALPRPAPLSPVSDTRILALAHEEADFLSPSSACTNQGGTCQMPTASRTVPSAPRRIARKASAARTGTPDSE